MERFFIFWHSRCFMFLVATASKPKSKTKFFSCLLLLVEVPGSKDSVLLSSIF